MSFIKSAIRTLFGTGGERREDRAPTLEEEVLSAAEKAAYSFGGAVDVPDFYEVKVSEEDYDAYFRHRGKRFVEPRMSAIVAEYASASGSKVPAAASFAFVPSPGLKPGRYEVTASYSSQKKSPTPVVTAPGFDVAPTPALRAETTPPAPLIRGTPAATPAATLSGPLVGGKDVVAVKDGDTVGAIWDESRPSKPNIALDIKRSPGSLSAHQLHGKFSHEGEKWFYQGLGAHPTTVELADGRTFTVRSSDKVELPTGSVLVFSESAPYTFERKAR